nr:glycosyltransferase family 4 protein [uncultured Halomonas sp.]
MQGGGAERVAALLCNHWARQGHEVTLMPTFSGRGECLYTLEEDVCLTYLADKVGTTRQTPLNRIKRLASLRRFVRESSPDVIVSFLPHVNVATLLATAGLNIPIVVSERTYPPAKSVGKVLEFVRKFAYPHASAVVMQTEQGREWLAHECPSANGKVIANPVVFPLPVSEPFIRPEEVVGRERQVLLGVGRLEEEKGFTKLIEAFAKLADSFPNWDLVILGEGKNRECLETQRSSLGLEHRVHLPGRAGNMADWYQYASLYVMNSRFEGFPNSLAEAMAYGLPVVSSDCDTGPRDIIRQGHDGLLVDPEAGVRGLVEALSSLMLNPDLRDKMANAAVDVRERFAISHITRQWDAILHTKLDKAMKAEPR